MVTETQEILTVAIPLAFALLIVVSLLGPLISLIRTMRGIDRQEQATAAGAPGQSPGRARVLAFRETGLTVNERTEVEFDLAVERPGQAEYSASCRQLVSPLHAPRFRPGCVVDITINETHRRRCISCSTEPPSQA